MPRLAIYAHTLDPLKGSADIYFKRVYFLAMVLLTTVWYGKIHDISKKVNMGFEPGEQSGAGVWEGEATDEAVAQW